VSLLAAVGLFIVIMATILLSQMIYYMNAPADVPPPPTEIQSLWQDWYNS
jgi:hypothetical protein